MKEFGPVEAPVGVGVGSVDEALDRLPHGFGIRRRDDAGKVDDAVSPEPFHLVVGDRSTGTGVPGHGRDGTSPV